MKNFYINLFIAVEGTIFVERLVSHALNNIGNATTYFDVVKGITALGMGVVGASVTIQLIENNRI